MKQRLARLVDVKSLITIALVGVLCFMTVTGQNINDLFTNALMLCLGTFFGKNLNEKKEETKNE